MKQSVMTFVGDSERSMGQAAEKADELVNEFIDMDDDILLNSTAIHSLYAHGTFYHIITIAYRGHLDDNTVGDC